MRSCSLGDLFILFIVIVIALSGPKLLLVLIVAHPQQVVFKPLFLSRVKSPIVQTAVVGVLLLLRIALAFVDDSGLVIVLTTILILVIARVVNHPYILAVDHAEANLVLSERQALSGSYLLLHLHHHQLVLVKPELHIRLSHLELICSMSHILLIVPLCCCSCHCIASHLASTTATNDASADLASSNLPTNHLASNHLASNHLVSSHLVSLWLESLSLMVLNRVLCPAELLLLPPLFLLFSTAIVGQERVLVLNQLWRQDARLTGAILSLF